MTEVRNLVSLRVLAGAWDNSVCLTETRRKEQGVTAGVHEGCQDPERPL